MKVGDIGSYGSVWRVGSTGFVSISRVITGTIRPWQELYSADLPGGLSSSVSIVVPLAIDCTGGAEVCAAVSGRTVSIGSRSDSNIAVSGEQLIRGSLTFPIA